MKPVPIGMFLAKWMFSIYKRFLRESYRFLYLPAMGAYGIKKHIKTK
jgi:hypothetical protein